MSRYDFIFSNKISPRISRHLLFWFIFSLYVFLFRYYVFNLKDLSYSNTYFTRLRNLLLFLPVSVFYAYFALYFLLPKYILNGRYIQLMIIVVLLSLLLVLFSYSLSILFNIRLAFDVPLNRSSLIRQVDFTVNNGLVYPVTISGFAIGIKMIKNFYLQQKENEHLAKQKIDAEIQLLKSQVHPRFLFHSLNSIYNDMLKGSSRSPEMLLKLSDLLSYILYESDEKLVPLEKEISLLQNYIDLERSGLGERFAASIENNFDTGGKMVAPLLLLPLAEYVFEQVDADLHQPLSLNINMLLKESTFWFLLSMKGDVQPSAYSFHTNVQLLQVQKRLHTLYPEKHDYRMEANEKDITISLSLLLEEEI